MANNESWSWEWEATFERYIKEGITDGFVYQHSDGQHKWFRCKVCDVNIHNPEHFRSRSHKSKIYWWRMEQRASAPGGSEGPGSAASHASLVMPTMQAPPAQLREVPRHPLLSEGPPPEDAPLPQGPSGQDVIRTLKILEGEVQTLKAANTNTHQMLIQVLQMGTLKDSLLQHLKDQVQALEDEVKQLKFDDDLVKQRENRITEMMRAMESWEERNDLKIKQLEKRLHSHPPGVAAGSRSPEVAPLAVTDPPGLAPTSERKESDDDWQQLKKQT